MEKVPDLSKPRSRVVLKAIGALTAFSAILSIGPVAGASIDKTYKKVTMIPNMRGYLEQGSNSVCYGGGPRPCGILIRTAPYLTADCMNALNCQSAVSRPLEAYKPKGDKGNEVGIVCYVSDKGPDASYEHHLSSTDWYEVEVQKNEITNQKVINQINQPNSPISTIEDKGQTYYAGYASITWFNENHPNTQVQKCK